MLFLRSLFWTILVPGTVTVLVPRWILARSGTAMPPNFGLWQAVGGIVIVSGAAVMLWCIWDFARTGRGTLSIVDPPKDLVVVGLYRYVRNPMYLGVLAVLSGEAIFFRSLPLLKWTAGWFAFVWLIVVFYEEPHLRKRFGQSYEQYSRAVRRWLPGKPYRNTNEPPG